MQVGVAVLIEWKIDRTLMTPRYAAVVVDATTVSVTAAAAGVGGTYKEEKGWNWAKKEKKGEGTRALEEIQVVVALHDRVYSAQERDGERQRGEKKK